MYLCFFPTGDKDVGSSGDPICSTVDALPDFSFNQLFCVDTLSECLVPPVLSDMHLCQQCYKPCDIQRNVSEVSLSVSRALPLPAPRGKSEDAVNDPDWLQHHPRPPNLPGQ